MTAILFINCATSGLIKPGSPLTDPSQPWVVEIAAELDDLEGRPLAHFATRIRSENRRISAAAEAVHGISNVSAGREGISEIAALGMLVGLVNQIGEGGRIVAHGVDFDTDVISGVLLRKGKSTDRWLRTGVERVCTMQAATPLCKIPHDKDADTYRWPKLDEAYRALVGEPPFGARHSAWHDMQLCRGLYWRLCEIGALEAPDGRRWAVPKAGPVHQAGVEWMERRHAC